MTNEKKGHDNTKVELEKQITAYKQLKTEFDSLVKKYELNNNSRNVVEMNLVDKTKIAKENQNKLIDIEKCNKDLKRQSERDEFRISELKREIESQKIKYSTLQIQLENSRGRLTDKITRFNEVYEQEKIERNNWMEKYQKEQRKYGDISTKLMETQSIVQDKNLELHSIQIKLDNLQSYSDSQGKRMLQVCEEYNEKVNEISSLKREL